MRPQHLVRVILSSSVLVSSGCTHHHAGAFGLSTRDRQAIEAYQKFKPERQEQVKNTGSHWGRHEPVDFQTDPPPALTTDLKHPQYHQTMLHNAVGSMGLWGQIEHREPSRSSPLDGPGNVQQVTFTTEGADFDPDLDPTGKLLIYASTRHRNTSDLYLKRIDGTTITQLTHDPANEVMPAISPDGTKIAFASDRTGNWDLFVMDADGGKPIQVTDDATHDIHPTFSPDGTKLAYSSFGSSSGQWEIIVVDIENNSSTRRMISHGLFPSWSPTEDRILFQRARHRGTRWFSIWTVDLVDGEVSLPTEIAVSSNAAVITPDWSPDSSQIVFCTVIEPGADDQSRPRQADIWVINADGTERTRLTGGQFANLQPAWAADDTIYFVSDRAINGVDNIWGLLPQIPAPVSPLAEPLRNSSAMAPVN